MNTFGGDWTKTKIEILVEYAQSYLTIMAKYSYWRTLYFDGFAGTGFITQGRSDEPDTTIGAAKRIIELEQPDSFDGYYFVEIDGNKVESLEKNTVEEYPDKQIYLVREDCNVKLKAMAEHLKKPKSERDYDKVLAYIDPCGMQLEWNAVETLEGIGADVWILVPTGMGVNRLLKKDGEITDAWIQRLEIFLGMSEDEIRSYFYQQRTKLTLFGKEKVTTKKDKAIEKAANLYQDRLSNIFDYVTEPLVLKNEKNSPMYHYLFASNNPTAHKIAKEIIHKYSN